MLKTSFEVKKSLVFSLDKARYNTRMRIQMFNVLFFSIFFILSSQALAKAPLVLFIGDSLTEGYGIEKKKAFPQLIKDKLKKDHKKISILNAGVSGSTSASALSRLRWFIKKRSRACYLGFGC